MKTQRRLCLEISLQASKTAEDLTAQRHYMTMTASTILFDPRYLVFEYTYSMMLRKSQVILVNKFMDSLENEKSMCHQMIMGAGKTTVVAPLLALMLADGKSLVTQVVPHALLEFSRGVMREKFSAVIRKPVFTFQFDRGTPITRDLYMKLVKARDSKAIICATPTSIKSFELKFVEMMRHLERTNVAPKKKNGWLTLSNFAKRFKDQSIIKELHVNPEDLYYCTEILKLFKSGVLLLDEVDLLLHPLKSELNWPIGEKEPIDFSRGKLGVGLRWQMQWHILDAIFYAAGKKMTVDFKDSREAHMILNEISTAIHQGMANQQVQKMPHFVLLERKFYTQNLKMLLARWQLLYLRNKRLPAVEDKHLLSYLVNGPLKDRQASQAVSVKLDDEFMKMLNLSHDLLSNFIPHVLSKINRVSFGILSKLDLKQSLESDPNISLTRQLAAIPFDGKDVPSRASQFSHPDVIIGLTILAYRYEGLRHTDFETVLIELRERLDAETGPFHKRPSALRWVSWVEEAGAKVRGPKRTDNKQGEEDNDDMSLATDSLDSLLINPFIAGARRSDDIWPLHLIDLKDEAHMSVTYKLLQSIPKVIEFYLDSFVFPLTMEHHLEKISASGQDLGGEMLFGRRVGFSGTPSDLLPEELGQCQYEEGSDGKILHYLTAPTIMSSRILGGDWNVTKLLDDIITCDPPFHCLIDTGALITGMSNYEVAKYLIDSGLPASTFDGVVFLDNKDRKMILLRNGMNVVRLDQAGCPPERRFSFYDQIHTTGMDIHQCIYARAALTLGKDMTFRDYAQGAFRMRGIGKGQTIELFVIPEVMRLIEEQMVRCKPQVQDSFAPKSQANSIYGADLLSMPNAPSQAVSSFMGVSGNQLLVDVSAWLTVNGMKSENMQFRMLCQQSIDNVTRKRAYQTLKDHYKELTRKAFASRAKEIAAITAAAASQKAGKIINDIEGMFGGDRKLFADDIAEIDSVINSMADIKSSANLKPVGLGKIQRCLDILGERINFTVLNNIPTPRPLSETIHHSLQRNKDFLSSDYDRAVVDKIMMVLQNSENLSKKRFGNQAPADDAAENDHELQREQVAEEEVLQEQEEEEEEEEEEEKKKKDINYGE